MGTPSRTKPKLKALNVSYVPADVKERLVADAVSREVSLNDVAVTILADHFGVRFEGTGRASPGAKREDGPLILRVPESLYWKIDAAAHGRHGARTKVAFVLDVLQKHYEAAPAAVA